MSVSDDKISRLVKSLMNLTEGELGVAALIGCGKESIPQLSSFLLSGPLSSIPVPRLRAVRVLGEVGGVSPLLRYLGQPDRTKYPSLLEAEYAVRSRAAAEMVRWRTEEVFEALLRVAEDRNLIGLCEAFKVFARREAIPYLIRMLADDVCTVSAGDALSAIASSSPLALISAATEPELADDLETPSSRKRRARLALILRNWKLRRAHWHHLRAVVYDDVAGVAATACQIGLEIAPGEERRQLLTRLLSVFPHCDWLMQTEIEESIRRHLGEAKPILRQYLTQHANEPRNLNHTSSMVHRLLQPVEAH